MNMQAEKNCLFDSSVVPGMKGTFTSVISDAKNRETVYFSVKSLPGFTVKAIEDGFSCSM